MNTWIVPPELDTERLDHALVKLEPAFSRAQWQKRIKSGGVMVDGQSVDSPHAPVRAASEITFKEVVAVPKYTPVKKTLPPLSIIHETADWMVIDKPENLLVHPIEGNDEPTLVDSLVEYYPPIAKVGGEPLRPGIIHRLDRDVSGLMLIAKTEQAFESLKAQFQQREIKKQYLALVHGEVPQDTGDIRFKIARSTSKGRMAARPEEAAEGKVAWTYYTVLERVPGATLLRVEIFSGRTHQIRAHLFALGHPVLGDKLYVKKNTDRRKEAPRLMLQSVSLAFRDPLTSEEQSFTLDALPEFETLLGRWRIPLDKRAAS